MRKIANILLASTLFVLPETLPARAYIAQVPGQGLVFPAIPDSGGPGPWANSGGIGTNLSAATNEIAIVGYLYGQDKTFQNGGTDTISTITINTASKTCSGCTGSVVWSIENWGTSGPPVNPGGLVSAGASATEAFSAFPNGGMATSPALTTPPTVTNGQPIVVHLKTSGYDTGNIRLGGVTQLYDGGYGLQLNGSTNSGVSWTNNGTSPPSIYFTLGSGKIATLMGSYPYDIWNSPNADAYNSSSGFNETGIGLLFNFGGYIDATCGGVAVAGSTATFNAELTDTASTPNVLGTVSPNPLWSRATGGGAGSFNQAAQCFGYAPAAFSAATAYRAGFVATGAGNITTTNVVFDAANAMDTTFNGSQSNDYYTRKNAAWSSATTTKRPYISIRISAFDIGTGSATARHRLIETLIPADIMLGDNEDFIPRRWAGEE
jgi:hypothetical protein